MPMAYGSPFSHGRHGPQHHADTAGAADGDHHERQLAATLKEGDHVGVTFSLAAGIMLLSTVFFFYQATKLPDKWQASMFTIGCVTGTAYWHYQFLMEVWSDEGMASPMYRYTDWFLTVPLQILEFWMILRATVRADWDMFAKLLVLSLLMLVAGYAGETQLLNQWAAFMVGMIAWFLIIFEIYLGGAGKEVKLAPPAAQKAFSTLRIIVAVGWSLYPIGYVVGNAGGGDQRVEKALNGIYNMADLVNKTAFGLAIYYAAVNSKSEDEMVKKKMEEIEAVHKIRQNSSKDSNNAGGYRGNSPQSFGGSGNNGSRSLRNLDGLNGGGQGGYNGMQNSDDGSNSNNGSMRNSQNRTDQGMRDLEGPNSPAGSWGRNGNSQQMGGNGNGQFPGSYGGQFPNQAERENYNGNGQANQMPPLPHDFSATMSVGSTEPDLERDRDFGGFNGGNGNHGNGNGSPGNSNAQSNAQNNGAGGGFFSALLGGGGGGGGQSAGQQDQQQQNMSQSQGFNPQSRRQSFGGQGSGFDSPMGNGNGNGFNGNGNGFNGNGNGFQGNGNGMNGGFNGNNGFQGNGNYNPHMAQRVQSH